MDALTIDDYLERHGSIMATMISEVYDAFIASGAPEDKARKAAEAMAAYDDHFNRLENSVGAMRGDINAMRAEITRDFRIMRADLSSDLVRAGIKNDLTVIRSDLNQLKWMNGITWALCLAILLKVYQQ